MGNRSFEVKPSKGSGLDKFDVAYFTASCDDPETNRKYAETLKLDFPILSDPEKTTAKAFGVVTPERAVPFRWTYFIGKNGKVLFVDKDVKAATHAEAIVAKLKELGVSQQ